MTDTIPVPREILEAALVAIGSSVWNSGGGITEKEPICIALRALLASPALAEQIAQPMDDLQIATTATTALRAERDAALSEVQRLRAALQNLVETVEIAPGDRAAYYDIDYMTHAPSCENRGDQSCDCGATQHWCNIDQLLDECEGYNGTAAIDIARAALGHSSTHMHAYATTALRAERDAALAEVQRLRDAFGHFHKRLPDSDQCAVCHLDLRDPIHTRATS